MHPAVLNGSYDVERVREDFPALAVKVYGKPLVYLDNAASAQKPNAVLDRMAEAYKTEYANVHRGLHYLANAATEAYEGARTKVAKFLNARRSEEIIFTRNVTEAINLVASSWGEPNIKAGDEIVLSVKEVVKIAHARGIPVLVDGAQGAVHLDVDVQDLDCDFYAFTGHKLYGPTGIGALYAKYDHLVAMRPYNGGGEMIREVAKDWITYGDPPHKFEAGTPPIVQAIGLGAAIDYVSSKGKGPIISFDMKGAHAHDIATVIDRQGVAVRAGTHCVMPLLERFNVTATCRASFGMYNTREEVDHLAQALIKARELFA